MPAALTRLDKRVVGNIHSVAGGVQIDPGFAGHRAAQRYRARFRAGSSEGTGGTGQCRQLDSGKRGLRQSTDNQAQQASQDQTGPPRRAWCATGRFLVAGGLHVCRIIAAEGGRKKTYLHQRHLEKRAPSHTPPGARGLRCARVPDAGSVMRWSNEVFSLTRSSSVS